MSRVAFLVVALFMSGAVFAGPQTKIAAISPKYPTEEIEITWETALAGGCSTSTVALTNPGAANHKALVATLLAALAENATVEVFFGGGCTSSNTNWIQTVRMMHP